MDIFEERIKPLIEKKRIEGVDDIEMERAMGLPAHSIYKWIKQGYKSYMKYIPQIASYFHVSVDYLTGASDEKTPAATTGASEIKQKAIDEILAANDADVQMFMEMLRVVQKKNPAG